ncbi:MAG TPA: hypothetical protein VNE62_10060 [Actinomycetota bacterium]|nr:hypothetical protein [Actinomycetota bacterium]
MRRILITFLAFGLLIGAVVPAQATTRVERTVEGSYGAYPAPATGCNEVLGPWACLGIPTEATEAYFTAKVTDTHGQPVYVEVRSDGGSTVNHFCGETSEPIYFTPGSGLEFDLGLGRGPVPLPGLNGCPATDSIKTSGTIRVTLSNLP